MKYKILVNILDQIRKDAPIKFKFFHPDENDLEKVNQARAKALIHLYLKIKFGILDFEERSNFVTDGTGDGGIDGYFIDKTTKTIHILQSKFRINENNFEEVDISYKELFDMEIKRIFKGETEQENQLGSYNGKIKQMQLALRAISDIPNWDWKVVIIANLKEDKLAHLDKITGGYNTTVFDFKKTYLELVFPVVSGTYYNDSNLNISLDVENKKNSIITYEVKTEYTDCIINVVFVPTIEIAKIVSKYKNTILKFNPRSYLDLVSNTVNPEIKKTIMNRDTNEFALFNNGVTILSDRTTYSEDTAIKNRAIISLKNPQIINGGQTAYTLSRILEEDNNPEIFNNKEVIVKIISFREEQNIELITQSKKLELIEAISKATNQQTSVTDADRRSNDRFQIEGQEIIFKNFGFFYERKRGEFGDGLRQKYIERSQIVYREQFLRVAFACQRKVAEARRMSEQVLFTEEHIRNAMDSEQKINRAMFGYLCLSKLTNIPELAEFGNSIRYGKMAVVFVLTLNYYSDNLEYSNYEVTISSNLDTVLAQWSNFESYAVNKDSNYKYFKRVIDPNTGEKRVEANYQAYYKGSTINNDLKDFFIAPSM